MVDAPNNYVKEYDCGVSIDGDDISALEIGIRELVHLDEETRKRMGENGVKAAKEFFNYRSLSEKFESLMK